MDAITFEKNIPYAIRETDFKGLGERRKGKVRDIYIQKDRLILVSTDRHSSFDRIIAHVPGKGEALTQISAFWFEATKDIVQNHVIAIPSPNAVVAKRCTVVPIEVVVRGYITGVTGTSLWTKYEGGERDFGDFTLPDGLRKNQKLPHPLLTPTTKSDEHDRPISGKEIVAEKIVEETLWRDIERVAIALFERGQAIAAERGLILVDTKYEFGIDAGGKLMLIDEIHTPDSSRYWKMDTYDERFGKGEEPEYFDKEFLRLWFKEHSDPYKDKVLPDAPKELVAELARRYAEIYETLTGKPFVFHGGPDALAKIEKDLAPYKI